MADPNDHPDLLRSDDVDEIAQRTTDLDGEDRGLPRLKRILRRQPQPKERIPMPSKASQEKAHDLLKQIDEEGEGLTKWEIGFVSGLTDKNWRYFTDKQIATINEIADRRLS